MKAVERLHGSYVHTRRVAVLADALAGVVPHGARVLDVGAGDGLLAASLARLRPDIEIEGVDVLVRGETHVPVRPFDGRRLPLAAGAVDTVVLVDVLHHADDPPALLRECARVAGRDVVVKDHLADGVLARPTLRFMDRVGNARHGVALPHNYLTRAEWDDAIAGAGLRVAEWRPRLGLYPFPASLVFDRGLHFLARLERAAGDGPDGLAEGQANAVEMPQGGDEAVE